MTLGRSPLFLAGLIALPLAAQHRAPDFSHPAWRSPVEFTTAFSIRELADGRLIVPDPQDKEIRLLDAQGRLLGTIGRTGGGPQEFAIAVFVLPQGGDSTLVVDRDQERFLLIGPNAQPVRTIPWPRFAGSGLRNFVQAHPDGRIVFAEDGLPRPGLTRTTLLRWDRLRDRLDTITTLATPGVTRYTRHTPQGEVGVTRVLPYADGDGWAVGPAGEIAVVHPEPYSIEWFLPDGRHITGSRIATPRIPVTAADRAYYTEGADAETVSHLTFPEYKPAVRPGMALISPDGALWVRRTNATGDSTLAFDRIDRQGRRIDTIRLPPRRQLIGFGAQQAYLMYSDENDIQFLEAYR